MQIKDEKLYYIGGVVRDEVLGVPSFDIDLCYEGNAIEFAKKNGLNILRENPEFGTVRVLTRDGEIDIASTRSEVYPKPAHLPIVNDIGCGLKEDLRRRDFTINSMAKNTVTGCIIDYFNGLEDIKNKKIRVLHDKSFIEDPSRILRALKFSVRFGFDLDEYTKKLQEEYLNNINYDQSYHRLKKELKETFNLNSELAYKKFVEMKIYKLLGDFVKPIFLNPIEQIINEYKPKNVWMVYLGGYDLSNFDLTNEEQAIIDGYIKIKQVKPITDYEIYQLFKNIPLESLLLYAVTVNDFVVKKFLNGLKDIKINIDGSDLIELGFTQGEIFKQILDSVLKQKIINPNMTKEEQINWVISNFSADFDL